MTGPCTAGLARYRCTLLLALLPLLGCVSSTMIRTVPSGASVSVNGQVIGTSPVEYLVPDENWKPPYRYRVERSGYQATDGELTTVAATGRMVGALFTLGIVAAFRPMMVFEDSYTIPLRPDPSSAEAAKPTEAPQGPSLEEKLAELQRLHKEGKITTPEYREAKKRLLEEL